MTMTEGMLQVLICALVLPLLSSHPEDGSAIQLGMGANVASFLGPKLVC